MVTTFSRCIFPRLRFGDNFVLFRGNFSEAVGLRIKLCAHLRLFDLFYYGQYIFFANMFIKVSKNDDITSIWNFLNKVLVDSKKVSTFSCLFPIIIIYRGMCTDHCAGFISAFECKT